MNLQLSTFFNSRTLSAFVLALLIWIKTSLVFGAGFLSYLLFFKNGLEWWTCIIATVAAAVGSLPVLFVLAIGAVVIDNFNLSVFGKTSWLVLLTFLCTLPYGLIIGSVFFGSAGFEGANFFLTAMGCAGALFACSAIAMLLTQHRLIKFFSSSIIPFQQTYLLTQTTQHMETDYQPYTPAAESKHSNKTLVKALITGALILIMMIPALFVSNLVTEREKRQDDVVKEVSSKWASDQTIAGPYIYLPYTETSADKDNKPVTIVKHILLLPDNLHIDGTLSPEIRPRSIYKVLLYKSDLKSKGNFSVHIPKEIDPAVIKWADVKLCLGITDFKGIEEKIVINFNAADYELSPGLPVNDIDTNGLSVPLNLTAADLGKNIEFNMQLKIKGSEQLHFVPLSGNTSVALKSVWPNPSFDGNNLPGERKVDKDGFTARWTINKANLPFGTVLKGAALDKNIFAFGISMLQPADQYAKTMRSVKYAILFIGLTFSLFFIVEVMQKKPLHPVQYILVGLALVIFYTLLLSFSEFILFDQAYFIAALATIMLITLYAKGHFESWKTASLFGSVLCGLYGFIFVLVRLEDTALLLGSIGLFLILALVMYGSRKINWYHTNLPATAGMH